MPILLQHSVSVMQPCRLLQPHYKLDRLQQTPHDPVWQKRRIGNGLMDYYFNQPNNKNDPCERQISLLANNMNRTLNGSMTDFVVVVVVFPIFVTFNLSLSLFQTLLTRLVCEPLPCSSSSASLCPYEDLYQLQRSDFMSTGGGAISEQ